MEISTIEDCGELFAWVEAHVSGGLVRLLCDRCIPTLQVHLLVCPTVDWIYI